MHYQLKPTWMSPSRNEPIHRWYFITEGLPVELVRAVLKNVQGDLLEPFQGCGTALLEANKLGRYAVGLDVNPFMCFASSVKNQFYDVSPQRLKDLEKQVVETEASTDIEIPKTLRHYYSPHAIQVIGSVRKCIDDMKPSPEKEALRLAFIGAALKYANIRMTPAPRFCRNGHRNRFRGMLRHAVANMLEDLDSQAKNNGRGQVQIFQEDSRDMSFLNGDKYWLALSSPPYCNNVDFVRHSQLELYWLGQCKGSDDLQSIRRASITSCEAMAYTGKDDSIDDKQVRKLATKLQEKSRRGYHRVVSQYFSAMQTHFVSLSRVLRPNGWVIYVIGDSWLQGVYVPTHMILRRLARAAGFHSAKIQWLRYRNSPRQHNHIISEYLLTARR